MTRDRRWLEKATEWGTAHSDGETGGGQGLREKANSSAIDVNSTKHSGGGIKMVVGFTSKKELPHCIEKEEPG